MLAQHNTPLHPVQNNNGIVRPPRIIPLAINNVPPPTLTSPYATCRFPSVLDGTPPRPVPPSPSTSASEAAHNDVDKRNTSTDDSLEDRTDAVNDSHDAGTDGLED